MKSKIENLQRFAISKKTMITCKGGKFSQGLLHLKHKNFIPLRNTAGSGSVNGHWDQDDMNNGD